MMRSLWTSATGMTSQQMNVDTISHNLANVNTAGYKKERLEFQSLLYETIRRADLDAANQGPPVNLQVGHGVRPSGLARDFTQGNFMVTHGQFDIALEGSGFFVLNRGIAGEDDYTYTRDGSFKISPSDEGLMLVTSTGLPVTDVDGENIVFENDLNLRKVSIDQTGRFYYMDENDDLVELDMQIAIVQFDNRQGLEAIGGNQYRVTVASGEAAMEEEMEDVVRTEVVTGYIEMSNVNVAEEMVNLIVAQRAYELNSKAIQASDEMLQQANNLRR